MSFSPVLRRLVSVYSLWVEHAGAAGKFDLQHVRVIVQSHVSQLHRRVRVIDRLAV